MDFFDLFSDFGDQRKQRDLEKAQARRFITNIILSVVVVASLVAVIILVYRHRDPTADPAVSRTVVELPTTPTPTVAAASDSQSTPNTSLGTATSDEHVAEKLKKKKNKKKKEAK